MIRIGTSGWTYRHWQEIFYPADLPQKRWFEFYTMFFDTVELNATFYRLFPEKTFSGWRRKAPEGFRFAVKLWRWITHRKRLTEVSEDVAVFCRRADLLEDRLGPVLIQLPPSLKWSPEAAENFFASLPQGFLWAVEVRHQSWLNEAFYALLKRQNIALVYADHPFVEMNPDQAFGPFIYLRFHGADQVYEGSYSKDQLKNWAEHISAWNAQGKDVWVYFNNDLGGHAIENAKGLKNLLRVRFQFPSIG